MIGNTPLHINSARSTNRATQPQNVQTQATGGFAAPTQNSPFTPNSTIISLLVQILQLLIQQLSNGGTTNPTTPTTNPTTPTTNPTTPTTPSNPSLGNQTPHPVQALGNTMFRIGDPQRADVVASAAELQQAFAKFKASPSYPTAETKDLVTTDWGYTGSSSVLNAFYNYVLSNESGFLQDFTSYAPPPVQALGDNMFRVGNVQTTGETTVSATQLQQALAKFRDSPYLPATETQDFVTTDWGYSGSSSTLNAFYNYVLSKESGFLVVIT